MRIKEIIGLRKRPQMIALGLYIVSLVSLFLPFASVNGKTVSGISVAFSQGGGAHGMGFLYLLMAILIVLQAAYGVFLLPAAFQSWKGTSRRAG